MSKKFRETLVGFFVIAGIIIFIVLYTWLSGQFSLRNTYDITIYFPDVVGLKTGDPVTVYGLEKGKVKSLEIDSGGVKVVVALNRDVILPKDSKIAIRSLTYVGSDRFVRIIPGSSEETAEVYSGFNESLDLESMATGLDSVIAVIKHLKMDNLGKIAEDLSRNIDKNIKELTDIVKGPTEKIERVVEKVEDVVVKLDSLSLLFKGDGTVGKLLTSDDLYEEIRETNQSLKALIEDIKENPKKYINIKVF